MALDHDHNITTTVAYRGPLDAISAHNNMQPHNRVDWIIYAGGGTSTPAGTAKTITAIKTATYTAMLNEIVRCDSTAGPFTVNLPAVHSAGDEVIVKDVGGAASTNNITVSGNGHNIDSTSTVAIYSNKDGLLLVSDGTNWMEC